MSHNETCQEPTEVLLIGRLTGLTWTLRSKSNMLTPNINLQTYWQKGISHVMSGTIFFVCLTTAIPALSVVLRNSAWLAAPKGWRKGCKNLKKMTGLWRNPGQRRWTWQVLFLQVLHLWTVRLRREAWGYSKLQVNGLDYQGGLMQAQIKNSNPGAASSSQDIKHRETCWSR